MSEVGASVGVSVSAARAGTTWPAGGRNADGGPSDGALQWPAPPGPRSRRPSAAPTAALWLAWSATAPPPAACPVGPCHQRSCAEGGSTKKGLPTRRGHRQRRAARRSPLATCRLVPDRPGLCRRAADRRRPCHPPVRAGATSMPRTPTWQRPRSAEPGSSSDVSSRSPRKRESRSGRGRRRASSSGSSSSPSSSLSPSSSSASRLGEDRRAPRRPRPPRDRSSTSSIGAVAGREARHLLSMGRR